MDRVVVFEKCLVIRFQKNDSTPPTIPLESPRVTQINQINLQIQPKKHQSKIQLISPKSPTNLSKTLTNLITTQPNHISTQSHITPTNETNIFTYPNSTTKTNQINPISTITPSLESSFQSKNSPKQCNKLTTCISSIFSTTTITQSSRIQNSKNTSQISENPSETENKTSDKRTPSSKENSSKKHKILENSQSLSFDGLKSVLGVNKEVSASIKSCTLPTNKNPMLSSIKSPTLPTLRTPNCLKSPTLPFCKEGKFSSKKGKNDAETGSKSGSELGTLSSPGTLSDSGTPTPTNPGGLPRDEILVNYQDGYLLFQSWVAANIVCVWDEELIGAIRTVRYIGTLVGGYILVGGVARVLATIAHAHARALLNPPIGYIISLLGEVDSCVVTPINRGQFTPLCEALCWVIHRLSSRDDTQVTVELIRESISNYFPSMTPPDLELIHSALGDLIRQRKVYHAGRGYAIVKRDTYTPSPAKSQPKSKNSLPKLMTTSEALTRAHGMTESEVDGNKCHAAVQTDLADLLRGTWPDSTIVHPSNSVPKTPTRPNGHVRTNSLRLRHDQAAALSAQLKYQGHDLSDVTTKGDGGSVLSKLLRVSSPRRRLATFTAQFPPPEWQDQASPVKHLHSVATQTKSSKYTGVPETSSQWESVTKDWAPRSSTLPRRMHRPPSTSPVPQEFNQRPQSASPHKFSSNRPPPIPPPPLHSNYHTSPIRHNQMSGTNSTPHTINYTNTPNVSSQYIPTNSSHVMIRSSSPHHTSPLRHQSVSPTPYNFRPKSTSPSPHNTPTHRSRKHLKISNPHPALPVPPPREPQKIKFVDKIESKTNKIDEDSSTKLPDYGTRNTILNKRHVSLGKPLNEDKKQLTENKPRSRSLTPGRSYLKDERKRNKLINDKNIEGTETQQYDKSTLQLELSSVHMNNTKKVVPSPQKPQGLTNNDLHSVDIIKEKGNMTAKNLGFIDTNKCKKKMYITDDISDNEKYVDSTDAKSDTVSENSIDVIKKIDDNTSLSNVNLNEADNKNKGTLIIDDENSVKTYPSLSDLDLKFSSFTAQKILKGVSMNSIDTLLEVNMVAEKQKRKLTNPVTNTDFGFL